MTDWNSHLVHERITEVLQRPAGRAALDMAIQTVHSGLAAATQSERSSEIGAIHYVVPREIDQNLVGIAESIARQMIALIGPEVEQMIRDDERSKMNMKAGM
ncbi:MAG TPA: hypothetical protein VL574_07895 [Stellaceae bacterium]|jgi:hypothetical protein|nr:hypothetical protein [Stellaceae bacterium]